MGAKEEREVISYQHGYQDGKKAGEKYALSKEGHEAISYLEGHQAGEKQGYDKGYSAGFEAGVAHGGKIMKQEGRKEVVEWIEKEFIELILGGEKVLELKVMDEEWQAKLKKWGL